MKTEKKSSIYEKEINKDENHDCNHSMDKLIEIQESLNY